GPKSQTAKQRAKRVVSCEPALPARGPCALSRATLANRHNLRRRFRNPPGAYLSLLPSSSEMRDTTQRRGRNRPWSGKPRLNCILTERYRDGSADAPFRGWTALANELSPLR